jgi:hypothetical protein
MKNYNLPNVLRMADGDGGGGSGGSGGGTGGSGGAGGTPDWRAQIPEDLRGDPVLKDIKDIGSLAKSLVHAQRMVGAEKVLKPQKNWTPEQHNAFYNSIGRPENADGYTFKPDDKMLEGITLDENKFKETKAFLHSQGLTDAQASGVLKYYLEHTSGTAKAMAANAEAERTAAITALKEEWGADFDTNVSIAQSVVKKFGGQELAPLIDEIGNKPAYVKLFAALGKAMLDDSARGEGSGLIVTDAASALNEIKQLKGDADFQKALGDRNNPGHKIALERWSMLHEKAYPTKK